MKNFTIIFLLPFLLFLNLPSVGAAEEISRIIDEQNRTIQNQQQFEQNQQRKNELQRLEIERKNNAALEKINQERGLDTEGTHRCFKVSKISFVKNKLLSSVEEKNLVQDYLDKCLTAQEINQLLQKISDYLAQKDYITSRAVLLRQNVAEGELVIEIIAGQLEAFIFNQETFFDKTQKLSAFGLVKEHAVLNLRDVAIGLDQINRLPSNAAVVKVMAGSYPDSSIIVVQNQPKNTLRTNFSFDDLGSEATGKRRNTIGLSYDNLLHLNDNLNISRIANDFSHKKEQGKSDSLNANFSLPFKGNLLTLSHSRYSYALTQGNISSFKATGQSLSSSLGLESLLFKRKKYRLKSQLGLATRDIANFVNNDKIDSSSRKASVGSLALPSTIFFETATLFLKPSYQKGLKIFNARQDGNGIRSQAAHSQFEMLKFYANYLQQFEMPFLKVPFSYDLSFDSQIAKQKLYSSDQFFLGGPYTVRGFEGGSISGDSGYLVKNEVRFNVGKIAAALLLKGSPAILNSFAIVPFYDYGYVKMRGINQSGRLSGGGFRTSFAHRNFTANLTMSWVANKSVLLQNHYSENQAVYFDVATEFGVF